MLPDIINTTFGQFFSFIPFFEVFLKFFSKIAKLMQDIKKTGFAHSFFKMEARTQVRQDRKLGFFIGSPAYKLKHSQKPEVPDLSQSKPTQLPDY